MRYIDGYVLVVPKKQLALYKKMAKEGGKAWMKHGALQYVESIGEDMASAAKWGATTYPKLTGAKKGDTIVFSFIVYRSKKHRDAVNKKVHAQMEIDYAGQGEKDMPFDMKRMSVGGFETIVDL
jgi:alkaline phosphatase